VQVLMKESPLIVGPVPQIVEVPQFTDSRGTLAVLEWSGCLPFIPERFYFIREVPEGTRRAAHAHWEESEAIFALHGRLTVLTDDGCVQREWHLLQPHQVLLIPPLVWHELYDFGPGAICGVLASHRHNGEDYCRDFDQFHKFVGIKP
jgi:oxalate decarboxylase/phosphoglucose isomerase-like protein (cupin superfamily)